MKRIALTAMAIVTAWSLWAWHPSAARAQGRHEPERATLSHVAPAGTPGAGAREESAGEGPAPMNWTEFGGETPPFVAMIINFAILIGGYYLIGRKPIAAALVNRRNAVAKEIEEADRMRREAEERAKVYQAKLERLEDEMRTAREALVRAGEAERDRIVAEAEASAERMRRDAQFVVEQEIKQIHQDLWREALDTAVSAAEDLLRRRVTAADQERLAEDYLAELGGKPRPASAPTPTRPALPGAEGMS